jgi:hypothetical protein
VDQDSEHRAENHRDQDLARKAFKERCFLVGFGHWFGEVVFLVRSLSPDGSG